MVYGLWEKGKRLTWFDEKQVEAIIEGKFDYRKLYQDQNTKDLPIPGSKFEAPKEFENDLNATLKEFKLSINNFVSK